MQKITRKTLLATTAVAVALLLGTPAHAADKTSLSKLQEQLAEMQKQIDALKSAQTAPVAAPVAAVPAPAVAGTAGEKLQASVQDATGIKVQLGGFFEGTGIYRTKNEGTDVGSNYNASIPWGKGAANAHQSEFRGSARNTRVSLLASGAADKDTNIAGYFEVDFAGTGANSNTNSTSNYVPRIRQGYATYERSDLGFKVLAGQAWSLATQNSVGIEERKENVPQVIDAGQIPGTVYTREAQLRFVKSLNAKKVNLGLSFETPDAVLPNTATLLSSVNTPNQTNINGTNVNSSVEYMPDVIAKVAYDPGFGHYELFGIGRTFQAHITSTHGDHTAFAVSGGASATVPLFDKKVDVTAKVLAGQSTGRYGAAQLPDYAFTANGGIKPLLSTVAQFGVTGHVDPTWDVYGYTGIERIFSRVDGSIATGTGYGSFAANNSGCDTEGGTCQAQTRTVWSITMGTWKSVYQGNLGKVAVGLQDTFVRKEAFTGASGTGAHGTDNITMVAFRFTPKF